MSPSRPAVLYAVTVVDPSADLVISVPFLDHPVGIAMGSRNSVPECRPAPGAGPAGAPGLACTGATWVATPRAGAYSVTLTVPARAPCVGAASPASCVPALDYAPGTYVISIQALEEGGEAAFGVTAYLSNAALTLVAGQPQSVSQDATGSTQVRRAGGGERVG